MDLRTPLSACALTVRLGFQLRLRGEWAAAQHAYTRAGPALLYCRFSLGVEQLLATDMQLGPRADSSSEDATSRRKADGCTTSPAKAPSAAATTVTDTVDSAAARTPTLAPTRESASAAAAASTGATAASPAPLFPRLLQLWLSLGLESTQEALSAIVAQVRLATKLLC